MVFSVLLLSNPLESKSINQNYLLSHSSLKIHPLGPINKIERSNTGDGGGKKKRQSQLILISWPNQSLLILPNTTARLIFITLAFRILCN